MADESDMMPKEMNFMKDPSIIQDIITPYTMLLKSGTIMKYNQSVLFSVCREFDDPELQLQYIITEQDKKCQKYSQKFGACKDKAGEICIKETMKYIKCMTSEARRIISDGKLS